MQSVMQLTERKPLYYEARAYCERFDLECEDLERVRTALACRELRERMQPWYDMLAKQLACFVIVPGEEWPEPLQHMRGEIEKIARHEAESLGLSYTENRQPAP